jgi:hypothetical protein
LLANGFARARPVDGGVQEGSAESCAICDAETTVEDVERCSCDTTLESDCPIHASAPLKGGEQLTILYYVNCTRSIEHLSPEAIQAAAKAVAESLQYKVHERWPDFEPDIIGHVVTEGLQRYAGLLDIDRDQLVIGSERPDIIAALEELEEAEWVEQVTYSYEEGLKAMSQVQLRCCKCFTVITVAGAAISGFNVVDPIGDHGDAGESKIHDALHCPFCMSWRGGNYPLEWDREATGLLPAPHGS